ncbi:MAG: hypothetical protein AABX01_06180 [Candidatus Micrarchaeota archaeon]
MKMAIPPKKAQAGIELVTYFGFLLLLLILFSAEAASRLNSIRRSQDALEADKAGGIAAININIAVSVGDGYSSKFYMPFGLSNSNYTINITNDEQRLDIIYGENYTKSFPLLTPNVTGGARQGLNLINNTNGEIIIA